jgi:hypothetical protein
MAGGAFGKVLLRINQLLFHRRQRSGFWARELAVEANMQRGPDSSAGKLAFAALTATAPGAMAESRAAAPIAHDHSGVGGEASGRGIMFGALLGLLIWFVIGTLIAMAI